MRTCSHCGDDPNHQAEPPAVVAIRSQGATLRTFTLCGQCRGELEAWLSRRRPTVVDPPLVTITR